MIKAIIFFTLLGLAVAAPGAPLAAAYHGYAAPAVHYAAAPAVYAAPAVAKVHAPVAYAAAEPFDPNPQYNYGYSVSDGLTGDSKNHQESRNGDVVQGSYSLVEPDGAIRTVTYTADDLNGFNAVVDRQAPAVAVAKVHAAPVAYAAPAYAAHTYAAPAIAKVHHAAPVAYGGAHYLH